MLSWVTASRQSRAKPSLVAGEAAFRLGALAILSTGKSVVHHSPISSRGRSHRVARIDRNDGAADAQFAPTQSVVMLRVIPFVGQHPTRPEVHRCLPHRRRKLRRVLTRPLSSNRCDDQLRSRVKDCGQLGPGSVRRRATATPSLKVSRSMSGFQSRRVDCRRVGSVIADQAARSSADAASMEKLSESPFSRSFCSTCHNVE